MKRFFLLLLTCCCLLVPALAEDAPDALFAAAHPGWEAAVRSQWGDTVAAIMTHGEERALCVAERTGGAWTLTVDNPKALLSLGQPGDAVSLLVEDGVMYFGVFNDSMSLRLTARKENTLWHVTSASLFDNRGTTIDENALSPRDGKLWREHFRTDENDNILRRETWMPLPAAWMESAMALSGFDASRFPFFIEYPDSADQAAMAEATAELLPGYTYLGGCLNANNLELFLRRPSGEKVFAGVTWDGENWRVAESSPLPEDAEWGLENFWNYVYLPTRDVVAGLSPWANGTWGVNFLMPDDGDGDMMLLREHTVADGNYNWAETLLVGDHPWADITDIDWMSLPRSFDEARESLDNSAWAMVNNPDNEDRLHLREKPERGARSLGKYYNGTPVRVLENRGDWAQVDIFGVTGWMMTEYLAFGNAMETVDGNLQAWFVRDTLLPEGATLYDAPGGKAVRTFTHDPFILGLLGDEWFHVLFEDSGETGYVRQEDLWPGNG